MVSLPRFPRVSHLAKNASVFVLSVERNGGVSHCTCTKMRTHAHKSHFLSGGERRSERGEGNESRTCVTKPEFWGNLLAAQVKANPRI